MSERITIPNNLPKPLLAVIMALCLLGVAFVSGHLNKERGKMSPTYVEPLHDAPPMLSLASEAFGGFRGVISTYLWHRSNDMQQAKKYPEQMQLNEWITQIQPHVPQAWSNRAWNLGYNIASEFPDPETRWNYIYSSVKMLRDDGIRYNPTEPLVYDTLAYFFEHKIGHNLDDFHRYYKFQWLRMMINVLWESEAASHAAKGVPDFDAFINPNPNDAALLERVRRLRQEFGLDPREMKAIHRRYGIARDYKGEIMKDAQGNPINCLDWRMAETHSLYWASLGLKRCSLTPGRSKELHRLERKVYVAMMYTFQRGKMNTDSGRLRDFGSFSSENLSAPNLDAAGTTHQAYMDIIKLAQESRDWHVTEGTSEIGHVHFLRRVIQWMYFFNREEEALEWLKLAVKIYSEDKQKSGGRELIKLFEGYDPETETYNLEDIVMAKVKEDRTRGSDSMTAALLVGTFNKHFLYLAEGNEEEASKYFDMAKEVHTAYQKKFEKSQTRMGIAEFDTIRMRRLQDFLQFQNSQVANAVRAALGKPADWLPFPNPEAQGPPPGGE